MHYIDWQKVLKTVNDEENLNESNVIDKIKEKLQETDQSVYQEWENNQFNIDYLFTSSLSLEEHEEKFKQGLLHMAAYSGYKNLAQALLKKGANACVKGTRIIKNEDDSEKVLEDYPLEYAINYAVDQEDVGIVKTLLEAREIPLIQSSLFLAGLIIRNLDEFKPLLKTEKVANMKDEEGNTLLHYLIIDNIPLDIIENLLEAANVNIQNEEGNTLLHRVRSIEKLKLLIEKGADIDIKNKNGEKPLSLWFGAKEVIYIPADNLFWNVLLGDKEKAIKILKDPFNKSVFTNIFQNCWLFIGRDKAQKLADKVAEKKYGEVINIIEKRQAVGLGIISGVVAMIGITLMMLTVPAEFAALLAAALITSSIAIHEGMSNASGCKELGFFTTFAITVGTGVATYLLGSAFLVAAGLAGICFALYHGLKEPSTEVNQIKVEELENLQTGIESDGEGSEIKSSSASLGH